MNIFYLAPYPSDAAAMHCDKHVVKMIVETAQLLSTAHRVIDGEERIGLSDSGRKQKQWILGDDRQDVLYKATHGNHPSAVWTRQSKANYDWLYSLFLCLLYEYEYRYGKKHSCLKLVKALRNHPKGINTKPFTEPPPAMPDYCKVPGNSVESYRKYYIMEKRGFAKWTKRNAPTWFV